MSLYNHVEIWKDRPQMWPKGIYCNGHIMVDAEKMVSMYAEWKCEIASKQQITENALVHSVLPHSHNLIVVHTTHSTYTPSTAIPYLDTSGQIERKLPHAPREC